VKASKASSRAATLRRRLGIELPCEPLLVGGLPLFGGPPPFWTGGAGGVRLLLVCVGLAEDLGAGVGAVSGVGVGVTGGGVGVTVQLQETLTEFMGPVKVIVSFAGQVMVEGIVMVTEACPLGGSIPPAGVIVTPEMPLLVANQVRLRLGLLLLTVTRHCLQVVRFVGETTSSVPAGKERAGAADADLAPESSGQNRARALEVMSAKSAKRSGRWARTLGGTMIVPSLLLRQISPVVILPGSLLGRPGCRGW
jgi:hypothetical protein